MRRSMRPAVCVAAVGLWVSCFAHSPLAKASDVESGLTLLKEGDALADKGETTEAEIRYQKAMEKLLPGLRRLPFKTEVKRDVTPREKIRDYIAKELDEESTPEEQRAEELAMKTFGLLPQKLDLRETMLKLYTEEVGAFYDPKTDTMHLILENGPGRKPGLLEVLLGRKAGFNKDETKITIAHELAHALADQHFDLDEIQAALKENEDRSLAFSALVEGEATLVMMGASLEDWTGEATVLLPAEQLGRTFTLMMPLLRFAGGASLRSAPPILSESMLFPYLRGLVFCTRLANDEGWKGIDRAYARLPLSTEQILHPEKYAAEPDLPMEIDLGALEPGEAWKELTRNVLGEFQIGVLLRAHKGRDAAAGWDGDRYAVFEGSDGALGLIWFTTWDSEADAREFLRSIARYQVKRFEAPAPLDDDFDALSITDGNRTHELLRRGNDVVVVQGFPKETARALLESALKSTKRELSYPD